MPVIEFAFRHASLRSVRLTVFHCYGDLVVGAGFAFAIPELEAEELPVVLSQSIAGVAGMAPMSRSTAASNVAWPIRC